MAGIPYVSDPLQMLWQFQQDQARTNLLNSQSRLTDANTQETQIKNLLMGQGIQANTAIQKAASELAQQDMQQAPQAPNAPVYRDDAQQGPMPNGEAVAPLPRQTAAQPQPRPELSPIEQAAQDLDSRMKTAVQYEQIVAKARQQGVAPEYLTPYIKQAQEIRAKAADDRIKLMTEQGKQLEQIGGIAGGVADARTPEALALAVRQIAAIDPRILGRLPVEFDPATGQVVPSDRTYQAFANLGQMSMDRAKQLKAQNDVNTLAQTQTRDNESARTHKENERLRDAEIAQQRDSTAAQIASREKVAAAQIAARRANLERTLEVTGTKREYDIAKDDQKQIYKLGDTYKIADYQKGAEVADRVAAQLADPKLGYQSITAPTATALVSQARLMLNNYRARAGTKAEEAQIDRMNGMLDKMQKYTTTIGEGEKYLAKGVMLQLVDEMKTMYADRNADLLRQELNIAQNTNRKGGNATFLNLQGNLDNAVQSGRAQLSKDGRYIAFVKPGKAPSKEDVYELPSAPEGRTRVLLPTGSE